MTSLQHRKLTIAMAALFATCGVFAATMSKTDYTAAKEHINADYKVDQAACNSSSGNAKDICKKQAEGKEEIAKAELEYRYSSKPGDASRLTAVKADAAFAVAKEMCDDKAGNSKSVCRMEAKATHAKTLADNKLSQKVTNAKQEASTDKHDADYKVAAEKCNSMAGDAKLSCMSQAKARYQ